MRIATFNCNSVRSRLPVILDWLEANRPDVLALQETKVRDEDFPVEAFRDAGWHVVFRGEKRYNGVAAVTRGEPREVSFGFGDDDGESETRLLCLRLGEVHVLNTYVPQGRGLEEEMFRFKLEWFARLRAYFEKRWPGGRVPVAWVGDLNVAPEPMDVHDSKKVWPHVCHCDPVISAFRQAADWGFEDIFRKHLPGEGNFTFWDYRVRGALDRGIGWRIDHILATPPLAERSAGCRVDLEPRRREKPSDHTVVAADFEI